MRVVVLTVVALAVGALPGAAQQRAVSMNAAYASFFLRDPPARSALGSNGLALGAAVEIECIAPAGTR